MTTLTEADVEQAALGWLAEPGSSVAGRPPEFLFEMSLIARSVPAEVEHCRWT